MLKRNLLVKDGVEVRTTFEDSHNIVFNEFEERKEVKDKGNYTITSIEEGDIIVEVDLFSLSYIIKTVNSNKIRKVFDNREGKTIPYYLEKFITTVNVEALEIKHNEREVSNDIINIGNTMDELEILVNNSLTRGIVIKHEEIYNNDDLHDELINRGISHLPGRGIKLNSNIKSEGNTYKDLNLIKTILEKYIGTNYSDKEKKIINSDCTIYYNFEDLFSNIIK